MLLFPFIQRNFCRLTISRVIKKPQMRGVRDKIERRRVYCPSQRDSDPGNEADTTRSSKRRVIKKPQMRGVRDKIERRRAY
jgi:hypothetical protein